MSDVTSRPVLINTKCRKQTWLMKTRSYAICSHFKRYLNGLERPNYYLFISGRFWRELMVIWRDWQPSELSFGATTIKTSFQYVRPSSFFANLQVYQCSGCVASWRSCFHCRDLATGALLVSTGLDSLSIELFLSWIIHRIWPKWCNFVPLH